MDNLRLQDLQIVKRLLRMIQEPHQFAVEDALADKDHATHDQCGEQSQGEPHRANALRYADIGHGPYSDDGKGEGGDHASTGDPHSVGRRYRPALRLRLGGLGPETDEGNPGHGGGERDVVEAAAVIDVSRDGPIGHIGTGGVKQARAEQVCIKDSPGAFTASPANGHCDQEHQFLREIYGVQVATVGGLIGDGVLPRHHDEHIEINPPDNEQGKIQAADTRGVFVAGHVRTQG